MSKYDEKQLEVAAKTLAEWGDTQRAMRRGAFELVQGLPNLLGVKSEEDETPAEAVTKNALLAAWQQTAMNERLLMEAIEQLGLKTNTEAPQQTTMPTHGSMQ